MNIKPKLVVLKYWSCGYCFKRHKTKKDATLCVGKFLNSLDRRKGGKRGRTKDWAIDLPTRTANSLKQAGFNSKQEICDALENVGGPLKEATNISQYLKFASETPNIGKKSIIHIFEWLMKDAL